MDCCICYESIEKHDALTTTCNHTFHIGCIERWAGRASGRFVGACPLCRSDVSMFGVVFEGSEDFYLSFT